MGAQSTVTDDDLRRLLGLLAEAESADDQAEVPFSLLAGLRHVVPCDDITFQVMDVRDGRPRGPCLDDQGAHDLADNDPGLREEFWTAFWEPGGCSYPQDTGDFVSVLRRSDRFSDRSYGRTAMGDFMRRGGVRHEALVPLPPQGFVDRRLLLFRCDGPDFTDREVLLLRVLRPHLNELHLSRQRLRRGQPVLTARQWEIIRQVSTGASNHQVARAMHLSEATVRKHLENIFHRLDVRSRTEAVARVTPFLEVA